MIAGNDKTSGGSGSSGEIMRRSQRGKVVRTDVVEERGVGGQVSDDECNEVARCFLRPRFPIGACTVEVLCTMS